jgi:peptidylprolyl isomerase
VANQKRQRQDVNRAQKQQQAVQAAAKQKRRAKLTRVGSIAGVAVLAVALLAVFTRGGDDGATSTTLGASPTTPPSTQPPLKPSGPAPEITVPEAAPPAELQITDLSVGTGPVIEAGDRVEVFYTGTSYLTKKRFDENFSGSAFPVTVGAGQVILGWDEGLLGMREGGRRQLVIPPGKAYGSNSPSPDIAKDDTLIFVVEAARVTKVASASTTTVAGGATTTGAPATGQGTTSAPVTTAAAATTSTSSPAVSSTAAPATSAG